MLSTFLTGIIIGIFVSAPVGPIGILCIQRTISRGRAHGIITGLGATTSDLIYAILVGLSMTVIINFIETHQMIIQIGGSIIVGFFGLHIFRSNPAKQIATADSKPSKGSYMSDYITAFGLCISNPLIIFLFIGLFARFKFLSPEQDLPQNIFAIFSILLGAFLWWLTLTLIVGKLRTHFNLRGLWILNKITGSILLLLAVGGVVLSILGISL